MYRSVYLLLLPSICAFLLEPNNQQNATGGQLMPGNHYLTIARFLEAQQEQHRDTEKLHKTMDDTIAVLASQLQSKFADLERKLISDVKKNETCRGVGDLEKKFIDLENNYTTVLYELQIAKDENANLKHRFSLLMNETYRVDQRVKQVEQLKNIQSLQDLQTIHHQIQSITAQTLLLSQNQFARNQDFLALYNQTSVGFVQAVSRLKHLESFQNVSLTNTKVIEDRLKHLEAFRNISIMNTSLLTMKTKELQTQITNDKRPVAVTAVPFSVNQHSGYIVKFVSVKTSRGISGISSFKSSGKFRCEIGGLYIVSVSLTAFDTGVAYGIYLNGNTYASVQENNNKAYNQKGAITVVVNLTSGDLLWVQLIGDMNINSSYSCVTIVMIK